MISNPISKKGRRWERDAKKAKRPTMAGMVVLKNQVRKGSQAQCCWKSKAATEVSINVTSWGIHPRKLHSETHFQKGREGASSNSKAVQMWTEPGQHWPGIREPCLQDDTQVTKRHVFRLTVYQPLQLSRSLKFSFNQINFQETPGFWL